MAFFITTTALPITFALRLWPDGPLGIWGILSGGKTDCYADGDADSDTHADIAKGCAYGDANGNSDSNVTALGHVLTLSPLPSGVNPGFGANCNSAPMRRGSDISH